MNTVRKTLKDAHGDEVVYMHADVLDAPLDPAEMPSPCLGSRILWIRNSFSSTMPKPWIAMTDSAATGVAREPWLLPSAVPMRVR